MNEQSLVALKMVSKNLFLKIEKTITSDRRLTTTIISFATILLIYVNLIHMRSPILGAALSLVFFLVNSVYIEQAFFWKEKLFLRFTLGCLALVALLGFVSWATMSIYNLDNIRSTIALFLVATICSTANKIRTHHSDIRKQEPPVNESQNLRLHVFKALYLLLVAILFFLLLTSRSDEVYTVWQYLPPMFIPLFSATTFLLLVIIFTSEQTKFKLLFIIIHSILTHSLFIIVFPAGDISGQQSVLGRTRLVFDNVVMGGWPPWPATSVLEQIYNVFRGTNFQTAFSVIFARMLAVDVFWTHLALVPIMYSTFIPISAYMTTRELSASEKGPILAALLFSLFPATMIWGTNSVPNGLGYIFFATAMPFLLKYLSSNETESAFYVVAFAILAFLSHALTGIITFSLVLLAAALKKYEKERHTSPKSAGAFLLVAFALCISFIPTALVYLRFFYPIHVRFSLAKMFGMSVSEFLLLSLFGQTIQLQLTTALIYVAAPLVGLLSILYVLYRVNRSHSNTPYRMCAVFLFMGIVMFLAQHRILNLFMENVPFPGGRLWMFRDFIALPFVAIFVYNVIGFLQKKTTNALRQMKSLLLAFPSRMNRRRVRVYAFTAGLLVVYLSAFALISGWITVSFYRAYPHYAPLQTTTYELEAARHIHQTTQEKYIVICDQWFIFAAEMLVGINNPNAYYFTSRDPQGVTLFIEMKNEPSEDTMLKAMQHNNASAAYFVIEKPRLGNYTYNLIAYKAQQNGLQTYEVFFDPEGEEKLRIYYYRKPSGNP